MNIGGRSISSNSCEPKKSQLAKIIFETESWKSNESCHTVEWPRIMFLTAGSNFPLPRLVNKRTNVRKSSTSGSPITQLLKSLYITYLIKPSLLINLEINKQLLSPYYLLEQQDLVIPAYFIQLTPKHKSVCRTRGRLTTLVGNVLDCSGAFIFMTTLVICRWTHSTGMLGFKASTPWYLHGSNVVPTGNCHKIDNVWVNGE